MSSMVGKHKSWWLIDSRGYDNIKQPLIHLLKSELVTYYSNDIQIPRCLESFDVRGSYTKNVEPTSIGRLEHIHVLICVPSIIRSFNKKVFVLPIKKKKVFVPSIIRPFSRKLMNFIIHLLPMRTHLFRQCYQTTIQLITYENEFCGNK